MKLSGLIFLVCLFSACSLGGNASVRNTATPQATPGTPAQIFQVKQESTYDGSNDPWTFTYKNVVIKIVSIDQKQSFADDPNTILRANWLFRLNLQVTNPNKNQLDLYWDQAWHLQIGTGSTLVPVEIEREETQPGTTNNWLDFPLNAKEDIHNVKLIVGELDELRIETSLAKAGDLQKYRSKSITTNTTFEYGNSEWKVEKITSSTSISVTNNDPTIGTYGRQAKMDSRYITFQMKATPKNNGINSELWKINEPSLLNGTSLSTDSLSHTDSQGPQGGTLPMLMDHFAQVQDGTLIFQAVVDEDGQPSILPVFMQLIFPPNPALNVGAVAINFSI